MRQRLLNCGEGIHINARISSSTPSQGNKVFFDLFLLTAMRTKVDSNLNSSHPFAIMLALLLLSNFSLHGTAGVRGWFDVALR
jgi:hypothetical protein